ncbi:MAG: VWA domain-containing protein [Phaeodactylibacter sp.]|nr:VWA domain-containing protein [Phaeodactylibacter sp.]
MHHLHLICTFLLFAILASAQPTKVNTSVAPDSLQVDILDTLWQGPELVVLVQVRDQNGNFVSGLANKSTSGGFFKALTDKGQKDICKSFSVLEASEQNSPVPLNFSLVLDYSGSMQGYYRDLQAAGQQFIDGLSRSKFSRVNFDHNIDIVNPEPVKNPKPVASDNFSRYGGGTALLAAADAGIQTLSESTGARFVILFTDGYENASAGAVGAYAYDPIQLINNARANNTSIYAVGFDLGGYPLLNEICRHTGGAYFDVQNTADLVAGFNQVQANFNKFYVVRASCMEKGKAYVLQVKDPASGTITAYDIQIGEPGLPAWNGSISFGTLLFDMGSDKSKDKNAEKLLEAVAEKIVQILKNDDSVTVEVHGHASPDGEEAMNVKLSMRRAKMVYDKIVAYIERKYQDDVDALMNLNRMRFQFFGETQPLYPVTSVKNFENRRVEIITVKK